MFRSSTIRLTLGYTAIIMCISLLFSVALERVMNSQVNTSLRHQVSIFQQRRMPLPGFIDPFDDELLQAQVHEILGRTRLTLIALNAGILILGGSVSYWLARRTLRPIEAHLEAQRRFTADASHELRTPLTAIRTEIEVALRSVPGQPGEQRRIMQSTLEEVQRLENLSRGLLRLAQYEEGAQALPMAPVRVADVLADARKKIDPLAAHKHISIETDVAGTVVLGDRPSLTELLVILLDNAVKYSGERTAVKVMASTEGKRGMLTITDHGIGIKSSDLPHIFDRFYRADASRSKEKIDGYGLGLPIAKHIVERHHGGITISSEPDQGTTITVVLPQATTVASG